MAYVYPSSVLDNQDVYQELVGGFWNSVYGGSNFVRDMMRVRAQLENQTQQNLEEWLASVDRHTVPPYHVENWYQITLAESTQTQLDSGAFAFPAPANLVSAAALSDAITIPACLLLPNTDFYVAGGQLVFLSDPFLNPHLLITETADDSLIQLWAFKAAFDLGAIQTHVGSLLFPAAPPTTPGFLNAANAVLDAATGNTAIEQVVQLLAALTGCPTCSTANEVVVDIINWAGQLQIITDASVYSFSDEATPAVAVGNVLQLGQQLINEVQVFECNRGTVPNWLASLTLPAAFLDPSLGPLTFANEVTPLIVTENVYGYTRVEWNMSGANVDIINFFTLLHAKGIAAVEGGFVGAYAGDEGIYAGDETIYAGASTYSLGKTLAMLMDIRPVPIGQPTAASLPATINPLQFLLANVLRAGCIIIQMKANVVGPNALGLAYSNLFRQIIPPHTGLILQVQ